MNTVESVKSLVEPIVKDLGLELWDVRFLKEGTQWYLRIFIDKDGGVDINDCENVSRAVDKPLDDLNPIEQNYILEVSSPGIERELIRPEHFEKYKGADIMVKMIRPIENIGKEFAGVMISCDKDTVTIEDHDGKNQITINKKDAAWIKLDDFDF